MNLIFLPTIEKELKKLLDANIIVPLRFYEWISYLISVRKENGEIRLYVDFINLKESSLKDNYSQPKMDQLLQRARGSSIISMLDGFSGYNQILMSLKDT